MMRALRKYLIKIVRTFRSQRLDEELREELAAHVAMHTEDNIRLGMAPDEARWVALARLGGLQGVRQQYHEQAGIPFLEHAAQDIRAALRALRCAPAFVNVALITIALGIAGPTVMFVMAKQWILDPLPFSQPDDLIDARNLDTVSGDAGAISVADFLDWQRSTTTLESLAAYRRSDVRLTGGERAERARGAEVTPDFFALLGVHASLGRLFAPIDGDATLARTAIISDAMWRRQFRADPSIVGRQFRLEHQDYTIIGVLPASFQFTLLGAVDVWRPLAFTPADAGNRRQRSVIGIGRIAAGQTVDDARAEIRGIAQRLAAQHADTNARRGARILRLADEVRLHHDAGFVVPILFAMMIGVLLVACANVTNLMLVRASARRHEMAVRLALGASRTRIARQWIVEQVLLFAAAGCLGAALATCGAAWVTRSIPAENRQFLRNFGQLSLEPAALAFAVIVAAACGACFGSLPGWRSARGDVLTDLKDGAARGATSPGGARVRGALVVTQMALTLAFLIGAALLVVTARNITGVDVGFDSRQLLTFQLAIDERQYRTAADIRSFYDRLVASLAQQPAVASASVGTLVPFGTEGNFTELFLDGFPDTPRAETPSAAFNEIGAGYVPTMGLRLIAGRPLSTQDGAEAPRVAMIDDVAAARQFGGRSPISERIRLRRGSTDTWQIVGVVATVKTFEAIERDEPQVYVPFAQSPRREATVVLRASEDLSALAPTIRSIVAGIDAAEPIGNLASMDERIERATAPYQIISSFVAFFGVVTLLLAAVGVYGVVSYAFALRTREIGIRMALGACRADVAEMVLAHLRTFLVASVFPGLALAWLLAQAMKAILFGVAPSDWRLYLAMTLLLALVSLVAVVVPARRATAIDPTVALRYE